MSLPSTLLLARTGLRLRGVPSNSLHLASSSLSPSVLGGTSRQQARRQAHSVRIILKEDLPNGKAYSGDVIRVKAGYARNHLIPGKYALYATPENFNRLGMKDPELETDEEKAVRLAKEATMSDEKVEELKAADILKHYLRNKVLKMYRRVDPETQTVSPGMVDVKALRAKLSKQLMIDLEKHETIHILEEPVIFDDMTPEKLLEKAEAMDATEPCTLELQKLGDYMARISLSGGHAVPLKFTIIPTN